MDGKFVKAFGYSNGQLQGQLFVMKRSELSRYAEGKEINNYSTIKLQEGARTKAGTYLFDEGGGVGSGYCPHGYPEGSCPHLGCNDEVVIVGCPDCGATNGCWCPRCFYCGNKEQYCSCMRCISCHNKMPECTCYLYPDPGTGGGSTGGGGNPGGGGGNPGGSGGTTTSPTGEACKMIFSQNSELTPEQWAKLDKMLFNLIDDCIGGQLLSTVSDHTITVSYDNSMEVSAAYNPNSKVLRVKYFKETEMDDRELERTLYHEFFHCNQIHNENGMLNQEVEAYLATYRYAQKYGIFIRGEIYGKMQLLSDSMDVEYNITDQGLYDFAYQAAIDQLKDNPFYQNFSESSNARNFNTIKNLENNCRK